MNQVAGLLDAVMLQILQRTDPHHIFKQPAQMAFADAAVLRKAADGKWLIIMCIQITERTADIRIAVPGFRHDRVCSRHGNAVDF